MNAAEPPHDGCLDPHGWLCRNAGTRQDDGLGLRAPCGAHSRAQGIMLPAEMDVKQLQP